MDPDHQPPARVRVALLREAVQRDRTPAAMRALSNALFDAGMNAESAEWFGDAYRLEPNEDLLRRAAIDPDEVIARSSALIAHGAGYSAVIAARAVALALTGRDTEVATLIDHDRFLVVRQFPAGDGEPMIRELSTEIIGDLTAYGEPADRAIRHAMRNDRVMTSATAAATTFRRGLEQCVWDYIAALSMDSHPFVEALPRDWQLEGWAVVSTEGSHHQSHIHPRAWLSGVCYLLRPHVSLDAGARHGWLHIAPPSHLGVRAGRGWSEQWIAPVVGRVVLMPAYFFHETDPLPGGESRICVAFDVVPKEIAERTIECAR